VELKGVGFLWMPDLSKPDPSTVLAMFFGLSTYLNSKLMQQRQSTMASGTPAGGDQDMQATMNRMMPIMMYGMFVMMPVPSGVMIYMATQSLLGIAETRYNLYKQKNKPGKRPKASA
jgi:YidC/Oxa1 family membrane protein insertase